MTLPRSLQGRLSLALALGLTALWTATTVVTTLILHAELDQVFDSALEETGQRILPVAVLEILRVEIELQFREVHAGLADFVFVAGGPAGPQTRR